MKNHYPLAFSFLLSLICLPILIAQTKFPENEPYTERESDPYIYIDPLTYQTSPAYRFKSPGIETYQVNVNSEGMNMIGDAANEPSIAIDPTNPLRMAIGWRQFDTKLSNFRQAGYAFSLDGGINWVVQGKIDSGLFRSDPVLEFDNNGRFYYNSLSSTENYSCDVFRTIDATTWDVGTYAYGGDKVWMTIDKTFGPGEGNIYTLWSDYATSCSGNFNYSFDGGDYFEDCDSLPESFRYGTLTIDHEGNLLACGGRNPIYFAKASKHNIDISNLDVKWDFYRAVELGRGLILDRGPNPDGLLGQLWIATDHSEGPYQGNIYLLATVDIPAPGFADVLFTKSVDGGETWSHPKRINDDGLLNWNWFGTMSVAPNGRIDAIWLDTRDNSDSHNSALYYSYSYDGGENWSANIKLSESFDPHVGYPNQEKIGDYYHMISDNEGAHLAWAATFNGEQDVYYSRILVEEITAADHDEFIINDQISLNQNSPNPFHTSTTIKLNLNIETNLTIDIFDSFGSKVRTLASGHYLPGEYSFTWDGTGENKTFASSGLYFHRYSDSAGNCVSGKMIFLGPAGKY